MFPAADLHTHIQSIIEGLPKLDTYDIPESEDSCPICLTPFSSILSDGAGVTKLLTCNHIFCRKDLAQWIQSLHGNCPTCRHVFLDVKPPSESDDESSDGGEYIPNEDEDYDDFDDDGFHDTDAFSDALDYDMGVVTEDDEQWEDEGGDTDGYMEEDDVSEWDEEFSMSDARSGMGMSQLKVEDSVSANDDDVDISIQDRCEASKFP